MGQMAMSMRREFQHFAGLPMSGELDQVTVNKIHQPRCGFADVIKPHQRMAGEWRVGEGGKRSSLDQPAAYNAYTTSSEAFSNAFGKWAEVTPLKFRQVTGDTKSDFVISFGAGDHGDGSANAFDGKGMVLAHAYFPTSGANHFDDEESWTLKTNEGTDLEIVAAHEFGHALGLGHSSKTSALMAPFYKGYDPNYALGRDDIEGIQSLYDSNGVVYMFRKDRIYNMNSRKTIKSVKSTKVFPNAPVSPGAAVFDRFRRQLFIFKGSKYWRYTQFRLDSGYPRRLPRSFRNVGAAIQWTDGAIYLFKKNNKLMLWNEGMKKNAIGYPRPVQRHWKGAPKNIKAAFKGKDGFYYFLKGRKYWKFNGRRQLQKNYPKSTGQTRLFCG
ncbi:hypothetical protein ACOMHN_013353 [Nucella lapillus]